MRGKLLQDVGERHVRRIIPAHAGQTLTDYILHGPSADHPRACGANIAISWWSDHHHGSSPRMRGKRRSCRACWVGARIIPAHAGQTRQADTGTVRRKDHPRACGANRLPVSVRASSAGSSPRMRGKPSPHSSTSVANRIIPAHAGQTVSSSPTRPCCPDHPRACGAN